MKCRKIPCRICKRWFTPDARTRKYQKTCSPKCQKEWHKKKCAEWNAKNKDYFKGIYLTKRLSEAEESGNKSGKSAPNKPPGGSPLKLPQKEVQDVIGAKVFVIIEYLARLLLKRVQDVIKAQVPENKGENHGLLKKGFQDGLGDRGEAGLPFT